MLTLRSRWLLATGVFMIALALIASARPLVGVLGLGIVVWITAEGLLFLYRIRCVVRRLKLKRQIRDERGPVASFWAGRTFEVRLTLELDVGSLPYLTAEEPVPFGMKVVAGDPLFEGAVDERDVIEIRYKVKAARPGAVRFEGVQVKIADLHGFFHHVTFVRLEEIYRVLPALVDAEGQTASTKRFNMLPPPGIHRLRRPGSGSELLDLRDYLPGDPPKTIAWKVSARRDKLITKEFESEVPIRCTLFLDTSQSVRLGPPGRQPLTRLIEIASGVAQANLASRDLTGLCLFDEVQTRIFKPARTRRHLLEVFNQLADAAGLSSAVGTVPVSSHLPLAYAFAQEVYPEQLSEEVNQVPWWVTFLSRTPSRWVTPTTKGARFYRWVFGSLFTLLFLYAAWWGLWLIGFLYDEVIPEAVLDEDIVPNDQYAVFTYLICCCLILPLYTILWRDGLPLLFSTRKRRTTRMRKKMAALLSSRHGLGAGGLELLFQDDRQLGVHLERFLNEHHIPHTPTLFDEKGRYLFASPGKVEVLARALTRAVGKGHDNELFVLFIDLVELGAEMGPLLKAVKVALARHHQVMVVIPWPADLEPPAREEGQGKKKRSRRRRSGTGSVRLREELVREELKQLLQRRYLKAFHTARRQFARLQVPVVCAAEEEPIALILDRIDRLRGLRRRR